ncbi:MAG TPA: sugar ABC transporter permease, partial [Alphaproteobacteria bacterium]|nr:sugar ABC transporter permease [Alphaproteobacteria bacterium]
MTDATRPAPALATAARGLREQGFDRGEVRFAYLFVLPALLLVLVFRIIPLVWGFFLSLTDSTGLGEANFIGLDNYVTAAGDPAFRDSLVNTLLLLATLPIWI